MQKSRKSKFTENLQTFLVIGSTVKFFQLNVHEANFSVLTMTMTRPLVFFCRKTDLKIHEFCPQYTLTR